MNHLVFFSSESFYVVVQLTQFHLENSSLAQWRLQLKLQPRYLRGNRRLILATTHVAMATVTSPWIPVYHASSNNSATFLNK